MTKMTFSLLMRRVSTVWRTSCCSFAHPACSPLLQGFPNGEELCKVALTSDMSLRFGCDLSLSGLNAGAFCVSRWTCGRKSTAKRHSCHDARVSEHYQNKAKQGYSSHLSAILRTHRRFPNASIASGSFFFPAKITLSNFPSTPSAVSSISKSSSTENSHGVSSASTVVSPF